MKGKLFTISGPPGVGKSFLIMAHLAAMPRCHLSVCATTRPPCERERQHQHYHFVSHAEFEKARLYGAFLEWAEVNGNFYGTCKQDVGDALAVGSPVILEIDANRALRVKEAMPDAVSIFIVPPRPEIETLRERLQKRGTEHPEHIERRLSQVAEELAYRDFFDHVIVNGDFGRARKELTDLIELLCRPHPVTRK